jgi:hypothetical protein
MTALRVVTDHNELANVGSTSHTQIDSYLDHTAWLVLSGTSPIPPNGKQLIAGAGIQLTTVDNKTYITTTGGTVPGQISWNEIPLGTIDGVNKTFLLAYTPLNPLAIQVFVNGVKQSYGVEGDFLVSGSYVIFNDTFTYAERSDIEITYQTAGTSTLSIAWNEVPTGLVDGINKVFTLANTPTNVRNVMVYINGVKMRFGVDNDYTIAGNEITFNASFTYGSDSNLDVTYPY